jgi:hypothetical protein
MRNDRAFEPFVDFTEALGRELRDERSRAEQGQHQREEVTLGIQKRIEHGGVKTDADPRRRKARFAT